MGCHKQGPRVLGATGAMFVEDELRRRVCTFVAEVGKMKACERLRVGDNTIQSACEGGRLQRATVARIVEGLDREEAVDRKAS